MPMPSSFTRPRVGNNFCLICRRSLHRSSGRRAHILTAELPYEKPLIAEFVQEHAAVEVKFDNTRKLCHRCWAKGYAIDRKQRQQETSNPDPSPETNSDQDSTPVTVGESSSNSYSDPTAFTNSGKITSTEFMRAPNTTGHCIFKTCTNSSRLSIPESIKVFLVCEYKLYTPKDARICKEHLEAKAWDELLENCNVSNSFTAEHFNDLCNICVATIQKAWRSDFED